MSAPPRIGITVHVQVEDDTAYGHHYRVDTRYARAVLAAGGIPVLLPTDSGSSAPPPHVLEGLGGLLLSGGRGDRRQRFTGGATPSLRETDPIRYDYEVALLSEAWDRGLAVLGVCRGYQTMAEAAGGEVAALPPTPVVHDQDEPPQVATHELRFARSAPSGHGGSVAASLGLGDGAGVNSFHRQAVRSEPAGFHATAWTADDVIEMVESVDGRTLGVQFHPEWLWEAESRWLSVFRVLVVRAGR
jgi:putative glutamine amidotransferase